VLGEKHPNTITAMRTLSATYCEQGRLYKAEELATTALTLGSEVLGKKHPSTIRTMSLLSSIYCKQGYWNKAEELTTTTLALEREVLSDSHPSMIPSVQNLAPYKRYTFSILHKKLTKFNTYIRKP
jgi:Tetratricopeptide repeat